MNTQVAEKTELDLSNIEHLEARQALKPLVEQINAIEAEKDAVRKPILDKKHSIRKTFVDEMRTAQAVVDDVRRRHREALEPMYDEIGAALEPFNARIETIADQIAEKAEELGVDIDAPFSICAVSGLVLLDDDDMDTYGEDGDQLVLACFAPPEEDEPEETEEETEAASAGPQT